MECTTKVMRTTVTTLITSVVLKPLLINMPFARKMFITTVTRPVDFLSSVQVAVQVVKVPVNRSNTALTTVGARIGTAICTSARKVSVFNVVEDLDYLPPKFKTGGTTSIVTKGTRKHKQIIANF